MKPIPNEKDYARLVKSIYYSGQVNTFDLRDMGYEGKDLEMFIQYRLDLLQNWLEEFVAFLYEKPFLRHKGEIYVCLKAESGMNYEIHTAWYQTQKDVDYWLTLHGYEDIVRSPYPTKERVEVYIREIQNTQFGYEQIARKIVEVDSC